MSIRSHKVAEISEIILIHESLRDLAVVKDIKLILMESELIHVHVINSLSCH
jgi:hypothetical protein